MNMSERISVSSLSHFDNESIVDLGHFPSVKAGDWVGGHVYPEDSRYWPWADESLMLLPLSAASIEDAMTAYKDLAVVNANVLEWLLERPVRIPENWKRYTVHFLGTFFSKKPWASPFVYALEYNEREGGWVAVEARYNSKPTLNKAQLLLFR